ncbi:MAG: hypothetical protein JW942_06305 [Opitutales bacterium]|nr:hypothetical protein [Opitutales bacterium]
MNEDDIRAIARERARGINALERQWLLSIGRLASIGLDGDVEKTIIGACKGPASLDRLLRRLGKDAAAELKLLMSECDQSVHGLGVWIEATEVIYDWLDDNKRTASLEQVLGYLSCCAAGSPDTDLKWTASEMLRQYGMDRR